MSYKRSPYFVFGAAVLVSTGALAQSQDFVKFRASVGSTSNDNFFNTSSAAVSERTTTETIGVNLSVPYSLQRFELDANLTSNEFDRFSSFNYTGTNYNASWLWSFTPQLHGTLNSSRAETLVPATDSANPTQRNKTIGQTTAFSAAYELGGPWQLTAGVVNSSTGYERAVIGQSDNHSTGVNAGLRYALSSGNSLAYSRQVANGNSNTDYVQTIDDVAVVWVLSGSTTLNAHVANVQQHFGATPQFDFSGVGGGANLNWRITGKTSLAAGWQRDLASYQTSGASYTQTDMVSIAPLWQISPVTSLQLQYRTGTVSDQGNPFGTPSTLQDRLQSTSLSFSWQPYQQLSLSAALSETVRSSNVVGRDYSAHLVTLTAALLF